MAVERYDRCRKVSFSAPLDVPKIVQTLLGATSSKATVTQYLVTGPTIRFWADVRLQGVPLADSLWMQFGYTLTPDSSSTTALQLTARSTCTESMAFGMEKMVEQSLHDGQKKSHKAWVQLVQQQIQNEISIQATVAPSVPTSADGNPEEPSELASTTLVVDTLGPQNLELSGNHVSDVQEAGPGDSLNSSIIEEIGSSAEDLGCESTGLGSQGAESDSWDEEDESEAIPFSYTHPKQQVFGGSNLVRNAAERGRVCAHVFDFVSSDSSSMWDLTSIPSMSSNWSLSGLFTSVSG